MPDPTPGSGPGSDAASGAASVSASASASACASEAEADSVLRSVSAPVGERLPVTTATHETVQRTAPEPTYPRHHKTGVEYPGCR
ncbi:hypothetical protein PV723_32065, partial [Streptomyces sp. AK04-3B]|nr:hypothetical protein [Streptomyces sp. AK04-3B]